MEAIQSSNSRRNTGPSAGKDLMAARLAFWCPRGPQAPAATARRQMRRTRGIMLVTIMLAKRSKADIDDKSVVPPPAVSTGLERTTTEQCEVGSSADNEKHSIESDPT